MSGQSISYILLFMEDGDAFNEITKCRFEWNWFVLFLVNIKRF